MASGDQVAPFFPRSFDPPTSNYATFNTRNGISILEFDASTEQTAVGRAITPAYYSGNGFTVDIWGEAASATSGDVKLGVSVERGNENNHSFSGDSFATEQTGLVTANASNTKKFKATIVIPGAAMDGLIASEPFRIKIARKAADVADTMAGNYQLTEMNVKES